MLDATPRRECAIPGGSVRSGANHGHQLADGAPDPDFECEGVAAAKHQIPAAGANRAYGLVIPIDVERDTRWALVELVYGLQRDAQRRWRRSRLQRWWKPLIWIVMTYGAGVAADDRFHMLRWVLKQLR